MKIGSAKFAPANFHRNKTKSERKETHSGGGAAPGGSLGRFSGVALCALCGSLCGACVSGSYLYTLAALRGSVGVLWASVGFCEGIRIAARRYLRAAMRSNVDLCGF